MPTRKVSVFIYQYPKDAFSTLSLRRLLNIDEELVYVEKFVSSQPLNDILQQYCDKAHDYALMCDVEHCIRIVVRDFDARLSISFRA